MDDWQDSEEKRLFRMKGSWARKELISSTCSIDSRPAKFYLPCAPEYSGSGGETPLATKEGLRKWFCRLFPSAGQGALKRIKEEEMGSTGCWLTWSAWRARIVQEGHWIWEPESPSAAEVGWAGRCGPLHFLFPILQLLVIYRRNDLDPDCPEVSGHLKPITTLHSYYRF